MLPRVVAVLSRRNLLMNHIVRSAPASSSSTGRTSANSTAATARRSLVRREVFILHHRGERVVDAGQAGRQDRKIARPGQQPGLVVVNLVEHDRLGAARAAGGALP